MTEAYYAHSSGLTVEANWQLLCDHLRGVAELARKFVEATSVPDLPAADEAAGWLHDVGKYRASFQEYIPERSPMGSKGHKQAGAGLAFDFKNATLALAIPGHHGGMPDRDNLCA